MTPDLAAAIAAFLLAAAALLRDELARRRMARRTDELQRGVLDAKRAAGATRRPGDIGTEEEGHA